MSRRSRRLLSAAASVIAAVLTLAALLLAGALRTAADSHPRALRTVPAELPANRPSSNGPIVVAVALGASGTVGSDALAPYEVFADSPKFSVYTVAAGGRPAPVDGGPAIVPTYTFADVTAGVAAPPDVVVVPAVDQPDGSAEAPLRAWVVHQARRGAHILGVCAGARLLAATGLLDGRTATSHWSRLSALRKAHPEVDWVAGQRFVQDGRITTTAGITSGIPGALHVMDQMAGAHEATRVGKLVRYPNWSLDQPTTIPVQSLSAADLPVGLNVVLPWHRPTIGIGLSDGVGEIDAASAFEVYGVSYVADTLAIASGHTVTTRHGVVLVTTPQHDAPELARIVVPGAPGDDAVGPEVQGWGERRGIPVDAFHGPDGDVGFDGALEYLAATDGRPTALSAAKMIDYPTAQLRLAGGGSGTRVPILLGLVLAMSLGVGGLITALAARSTRPKEPSS
ncbi:MAG: hypothetical protein QOK15_1834 [Nocardioidaceae bacterium]|nr:hypothetical protein [Nocardioidaceae bacterium]